MAVVTYILLSGLNAGFNDTFRPQILGESASRAILVTMFDFLFIKLGCYVLNIQGPNQFVDILAFTGYKFVGVILAITSGFIGLKGPLWMVIFVYAFLANAFFLVSRLPGILEPHADRSSAASLPTICSATRPFHFDSRQSELDYCYRQSCPAETQDHSPLLGCCSADCVHGCPRPAANCVDLMFIRIRHYHRDTLGVDRNMADFIVSCRLLHATCAIS
jgi:YIF1